MSFEVAVEMGHFQKYGARSRDMRDIALFRSVGHPIKQSCATVDRNKSKWWTRCMSSIRFGCLYSRWERLKMKRAVADMSKAKPNKRKNHNPHQSIQSRHSFLFFSIHPASK